MKTLLSGLILLNVLVVGVAQAHANGADPLLTRNEFADRARKAEALAERVQRVHTYENKISKLHTDNGDWERRAPAVSIPELDANAAGAALALLLGGAYMLIDRKKRLAV